MFGYFFVIHFVYDNKWIDFNGGPKSTTRLKYEIRNFNEVRKRLGWGGTGKDTSTQGR